MQWSKWSNALHSLSLSVLMAIFQVNLGQPVPIEVKDDGGGGDNWTTGAISRAKLQPNHHHQQTNIQFVFYKECEQFTKLDQIISLAML